MIIDFFIILVVILSIAFGFRRGFCGTLFSVAAFALSIVIALSLYNVFTQKALETKIGKEIQASVTDGVEEYLDELSSKTINRLPFLNAAQADASGSIEDKVSQKAVEIIMSLFLLIVAYIVSKFAIFVIRKIMHVTVGLPIIHTADSILGGVCGLMLGIIWVGVIYLATGYLSLIDTVPILKNQFDSSILILLISDFII